MIVHACSGVLFSVLITGVMTDAIKDAVGRPRPDFFWRCFPDGKGVCFSANVFRVSKPLCFFNICYSLITIVLDMCRCLIETQLVFYVQETRALLKKDIKVSRVGIPPVRCILSELCYMNTIIYLFHFF